MNKFRQWSWRRVSAVPGIIVLLYLNSWVNLSHAQPAPSTATYFPDTTAIYLEIDHPDQLIDKVSSHPFVQSVGEIKQVQQALRSPQFAMAMLAMGLIESQIEEPLLDAIKTCSSQGLSIGVDTKTNGVAIVFKSSDEAKLKRLAGTVLNVVASGAKRDGNDVPFKKQDYRDAVAAKFDGLIVARYQSWFVVSSKPELAKVIVDNLIDGTENSLAQLDWYQQAERDNEEQDAWVAIDLEAVRSAGLAKELFQGRTDNPGAELDSRRAVGCAQKCSRRGWTFKS